MSHYRARCIIWRVALYPSKSYLFIYTRLFENLKGRILKRIITCSEMGDKPPNRKCSIECASAGHTVASDKDNSCVETFQEVIFTDGSKRSISSVAPDPSSSSSSLPELPEQLCGALELGFLNSSSSSSRRLFARQESEKDLGRSPSLER